MKVFFKYVLRSMIEKKGRFILLLLAIALSTALLVISTGLIDIILSSFVTPQLEAYENKDIVISSTDKSANFFSDEGINNDGIDQDSILKEINIGGMIADQVDTEDETMLNISIRARDSQYVNKDAITQGNLDNFQNQTCIISERVAKNRNLKIGDTLDIIIGGVTKSIKITAVSGNVGVFYNDSGKAFTIILPYEYLSKDMDAVGKYNVIFANSSESTIQVGVDKFNENNASFSSDKLFDEETAKSQLSSFTSLLYVMLVVVVVMSGIIIYSSFKLIITERLSTIGTFLSEGATVGKVKSILYLESFTYGLFGAVFGNVIGVVGLYIINRMISPLKDYGIYGSVDIKPNYIISGFVFAIILSLLSAYLPVRKISKLQVKDIILNDVRISKSIGWKKFIIGTTLIALSIGAYLIWKEGLKGFAGLVLIVSLTGVIMAYPKLIDLLSRPIYHLLKGRSKNVIYAINNLRTSKVLLGNITLIIISLVSIITIVSLGSSMIKVVTQAYTDLEFDVQINNVSTIRESVDSSTADYLVNELKKIGVNENQVNQMNYQYASMKSEESGKDISFGAIGIDIEKYTQYNKYLHLEKSEYSNTIKEFKVADTGVIITTALSKQINKKAGDTIEITCNNLKKTLTISGVIDGMLYNNGYFILIKNSTMSEQYGLVSANTITFNTDKNIDTVLHDLKPILRSVGASAQTRDEMCKENLANNQMMVNAMSIFSYLAIVIASLGIVNNVSISFLQRKNEFAILSAVGMDNSGRIKILFFESIASVTWAMLITSLYCIFGLKLISILTKSIGLDMAIALDLKSLPMIFVFSLVIVLIATAPVCFKSRKLSIIQEIKAD